MTFFLVLSYASGTAALAHGATRPASAWVGADRNRGYWLSAMAFTTLIALGIVAAASYLVGVLPLLQTPSDHPFHK